MVESNEQVFFVGEDEDGQRLDVFLAERMRDVSRSQLQRLIGTRSVQVNGAPAKPSVKTQSGDLILVETPAPKVSHIAPEAIALDIVFEDRDLLVVNKPKGMVVHPAPGSEDGTLVNALLAHCDDLSGIGGVERPGIVHRLDKDTTGLLVVAKNDITHNALQAQIQKRTASRRYMAVAWGRPPFDEAVVDVALGRHPSDRKRMAVVEPGSRVVGRTAVTELKVRERFGAQFVRFECVLQTGRTHQIRVHCAFAGFPVVGDSVYGGARKVSASDSGLRGSELAALNDAITTLHGQALHAFSLAFDHPKTGERMHFEAPLPTELTDLILVLRESFGSETTGDGDA